MSLRWLKLLYLASTSAVTGLRAAAWLGPHAAIHVEFPLTSSGCVRLSVTTVLPAAIIAACRSNRPAKLLSWGGEVMWVLNIVTNVTQSSQKCRCIYGHLTCLSRTANLTCYLPGPLPSLRTKSVTTLSAHTTGRGPPTIVAIGRHSQR